MTFFSHTYWLIIINNVFSIHHLLQLGPQHTSILYPTDSTITYRPVPAASQLIMNTRYHSHSHTTPYHLSSSTSTTSNSLQPLTHLPAQASNPPFQYLPHHTTPQHISTTFQQRHSNTGYGQVLSAQVAATSPAIIGTTSYAQRPSTTNYNVGYGTVSTTAPSFTQQQQQQQQHMHTTNLPNQSLFPSHDSPAFVSPQISQQQQWSSPAFQ